MHLSEGGITRGRGRGRLQYFKFWPIGGALIRSGGGEACLRGGANSRIYGMLGRFYS